jgi:hypothetical protein
LVGGAASVGLRPGTRLSGGSCSTAVVRTSWSSSGEKSRWAGWNKTGAPGQELKLRKTVVERRRDTVHVEMASRTVFDSTGRITLC